jgi:hypothetical protein
LYSVEHLPRCDLLRLSPTALGGSSCQLDEDRIPVKVGERCARRGGGVRACARLAWQTPVCLRGAWRAAHGWSSRFVCECRVRARGRVRLESRYSARVFPSLALVFRVIKKEKKKKCKFEKIYKCLCALARGGSVMVLVWSWPAFRGDGARGWWR